MDIQTIIATKRDGKKHTREELRWLTRAAATKSVPDYQLAAWLMAAFIHPLDQEETAWLTLEMADSGERLDLTGLPKPWVDKHSTGGVGDKTSIVVLPILAACGLTVVKMSGAGLGITGGTVDKLSSIPGFRLDLSPDEMKSQAKRIGLALTGQTPNLAPADKTLYSLRDTTATVASVPLIVSSILSKKVAGGADTVVLDVKCGSGAFMRNLDEAKTLAEALIATAKLVGLNLYAGDVDGPKVRLRNGGTFVVPDHGQHGEVLVALRPSAVVVSIEQPHTSARNSWPATIVGLTLLTDRVRIDLEGEPSALVDVTPSAVSELELTSGRKVWLTAKATDLEVYGADVLTGNGSLSSPDR